MSEKDQTVSENNNEEMDKEILKKLDRLQHEIWYTRIVMAVFFVIAMFYFNMKTSEIGSALGTFMEMFLPS